MRCPPPATGPTGRALAGLLAFVLASAVVLLPTARPAQAHGTLAMSTPAADATVTEALTEVELYFTEQVAANAYFTVTGPGGGRVDNGWRQGSPRPLDKPVREYLLVDGKFEPKEYSTGFPAVVTLAHLPAAGQYAVSYLSVASDGEPVRGTMSFRYTGRATAAPQGWRPPVDQPDPALVAAAEQHATSGHTGGAAPGGPASAVPPAPSTAATAAAPPAAATPGSDGNDLGWLAWAGGAVLVVAAVGFAAWRRRPVPAARAAGRAGGRPRSRGSVARSAAGARPTRSTTARGRRGANRPAAPRAGPPSRCRHPPPPRWYPPRPPPPPRRHQASRRQQAPGEPQPARSRPPPRRYPPRPRRDPPWPGRQRNGAPGWATPASRCSSGAGGRPAGRVRARPARLRHPARRPQRDSAAGHRGGAVGGGRAPARTRHRRAHPSR
ncbi:copper resistance CopC family protein [Micromonospora sp. RL09-050-HVF-A]|uniref:copper resistance CopC family protein n=1 Tax=Micromonospora sp. RL09-050-HVF-A TaxID=1703433 RepID=UPI001C5DAED8|nr:copper resistance CopC family protein [Micromonospora sp. RL09-050-HVF-A]MBW4700827.1 copper resistance protein CopC [Micromonospora sp. RL09-050-HVF-A]